TRIRRHAHGRQSANKRPRPLGLFSRSAESRNSRRFRYGDQRRPQSNAHGSGAGLADRRSSSEELENDRRMNPLLTGEGGARERPKAATNYSARWVQISPSLETLS